jgi:hypothetical protein
MELQRIFKQSYADELLRGVKNGTLVGLYDNESFEYKDEKVLQAPLINKPDNADFQLPDDTSLYDFENAKIVFEAYKSLTPLQASDIRLWTYLAHVDHYKYMKKRWPGRESTDPGSRSNYILDHWFILSPTQNNLIRHGIAGLWWGAYLTHDLSRTDNYELTRILFSQRDFATRTLGATSVTRHKAAVLGILEYILENPELFERKFQEKSRFLTKYVNQLGGTKPLSYFDKDFFKNVLQSIDKQIAGI